MISGQPEHNAGDNLSPSNENELHWLDALTILGRQKMFVFGAPLLCGAAALMASLLMTPVFTSTAKIMPPQQASSGTAALLGQLGNLAGVASGLTGMKTPTDVYVGMLESRTVADNLINRFKLTARYQKDTVDDTRKELASNREIGIGKKDGLIAITTSDKDPAFAAELANAYVEELIKLTQTMAVTEASQRRLFFENQLKQAKDELANAEVALRTTQEKTGLIHPEGQVPAIIGSIAQMKGAIAAKEVQINAMRTFATGQNPELLRALEELRGLQAQLAKLEKNRPASEGDFMVPSGRIPEAGVEYLRSFRNVKYHETIFELLAKQYELAKIDEAKDAAMIQLLDKAVPAERKSKPQRALITLAGLFGGAVLGILLAFGREAYGRSRQRSENQVRWQLLSEAWKR